MKKRFSISFSPLQSEIILNALKIAKRDYYSAVVEHPVSPLEEYELETIVAVIKKLENFRKELHLHRILTDVD